MKKVLELKNISFKGVLKDINISLEPSEVYSLVGSNGCGKSLLLKIACGLIHPSEGDVIFEDESLYDLSRLSRLKKMERIGFLFQNSALISNINLYENMALVLRYHSKMKEKEIKDKVEYYLNKFDLATKLNLMPSDLSMGEKKLAAFARAVINEPDMLILDEPTVLIDKKTKKIIADIIEHYREEKKTILMTSNDTDLIFNLSDKLGIILNQTLKIEGDPFDIKYSNDKEIKDLLSNLKVLHEDHVESEILKLLK